MSLENLSVLVTGGAGFIGSHLVDALLERNCRVTVLDNLSTGNRANLSHVADRITFVEGDIRSRELLANLLSGVELVFHQAAMVSVPQTVEQPIESAEVNDMGTLFLLELLARPRCAGLCWPAPARSTAMTRAWPKSRR